jgi:threonine synthase
MEEKVISPSETVVCILTGHELKDPNVTVKYHTGIDMKSVQDSAPRSEPHGRLSNRPVQVEDNLDAIIRAMGGNPGILGGRAIHPAKSSVPIAEY